MSKPIRIDQMLSGFADGDAISQEAIVIQDAVRSWGLMSDIFADPAHTSPTVRRACHALDEYAGTPDDILIHHYAIHSPAATQFAEADARTVLIYHNITPDHYFRGFNDTVAEQLTIARAKLPEVAAKCTALWGVSQFDADELIELCFEDVKVFPLLFEPERLACDKWQEVFGEGANPDIKTILFVGRIVPNKRVDKLIEAFYWYHRMINPQSRLVLIGSDRSCPKYFSMLRMCVADLDIPNVCFEGWCPNDRLPSYYHLADLFVSTSEHEGYCLPLLEAMHMGVPVIAHAIGGMPEAMGDGGVLYSDLGSPALGELMHRVMEDVPLRESILASQRERMAEVTTRDVPAELRALLEPLVGTLEAAAGASTPDDGSGEPSHVSSTPEERTWGGSPEPTAGEQSKTPEAADPRVRFCAEHIGQEVTVQYRGAPLTFTPEAIMDKPEFAKTYVSTHRDGMPYSYDIEDMEVAAK